MVRVVLFLTSGSISVCCYILIVIFLFWRSSTTDKIPKAYTAYNETTFDIAFFEESQFEDEVKMIQNNQEKSLKDVPIKKESASITPNQGIGINKLFKQIEVASPVKHTEPPSQNDKIAKNQKAKESAQSIRLSDELQRIMANLKTQKTLSFVAPSGEYEAFYAAIHEILSQNWNPMRMTTEHFAEVAITIDAQGRFSYVVVKKSGDLKFDEALKDFLNMMRIREFPRYEGGNSTRIMVTFKTEV